MNDIFTLMNGELSAVVVAGSGMEAREIVALLKPGHGWETARVFPQGLEVNGSPGMIFHGRKT